VNNHPVSFLFSYRSKIWFRKSEIDVEVVEKVLSGKFNLNFWRFLCKRFMFVIGMVYQVWDKIAPGMASWFDSPCSVPLIHHNRSSSDMLGGCWRPGAHAEASMKPSTCSIENLYGLAHCQLHWIKP
jgi:hypothetical protein